MDWLDWRLIPLAWYRSIGTTYPMNMNQYQRLKTMKRVGKAIADS